MKRRRKKLLPYIFFQVWMTKENLKKRKLVKSGLSSFGSARLIAYMLFFSTSFFEKKKGGVVSMMLLFVRFMAVSFLPWGKSVLPMQKAFLHTGGSILEGIQRGLIKYASVCTYSSIAVCYILLSTMVHPHFTPAHVVIGIELTFLSLSDNL
jgi:hypothetical protein